MTGALTGGLRYELGVRNVAAVAANFHRADDVLQATLRKLAFDTAHELRDLVAALAPVDTGFMTEHVDVFMTPSGLGFEVGWSADTFFSAGLEFYPWFQEFGTRNMPAQPSLGPASNMILPTYNERVSNAIRASIAALQAVR